MSPRRPDRRSADELVAALSASDFNERALALAELVRRGRASTPALLAAFDTPDGDLRERVAQALAEIADPAAGAAFVAMLDDGDGRVRSRGAQGLARIGDPRAVEALLATIDDYPDILREPDTLSTEGLVEQGPAVLPRVVPLLKAPQQTTRARAFLVVRRVADLLPEGRDWPALWNALGRYDPAAPETERNAAADAWERWVAARVP